MFNILVNVSKHWFAALYFSQEHHFEITQSEMRLRLRQLRALVSLSDPELYEFLSESLVTVKCMYVHTHAHTHTHTHTLSEEKDSNNLYFCFRWLLVNFKREFSYDDIMSIWEVRMSDC